jgi:hypothetical protein
LGDHHKGEVLKRFLALAAVTTTALAGSVSAAGAKQNGESFQVGDSAILGPVHIRGDVAKVHVRYSCTQATHLWVSVKQNASATVDPAVSSEGSGGGGAATSWWMSHNAGSFTCDGKRHVGWFTVDTAEVSQWLGSTGPLHKGWAWVQFCLTFGDEGVDAISMAWVPVVVNQ